MPRRATTRGEERTSLDGRDADVLICGASFAGLALTRALASTGARALVLDRYEIGEKQTSACGTPTAWLDRMGVHRARQQQFDELVAHLEAGTKRFGPLPYTFTTFDYRTCCEELWSQCGDARFETAKVEGRTGTTVHTDRGNLTAPLVIDALGWRRVLSTRDPIQPPDATLSRGLEIHPDGRSDDLAIWVDRRYLPDGYGWSFPAGGEQRVGWGSYHPRDHVKEPTVRLAGDLAVAVEKWQGNWIPHRLREATEDEVFFVGDSAGHCLPLTAEGIRPAWYFAIALGAELRAVLERRQTRGQALVRYRDFSAEHRWKYEWLYRAQQAIPHAARRPRAFAALLEPMQRKPFVDWSFKAYLDIAPPDHVPAAT